MKKWGSDLYLSMGCEMCKLVTLRSAVSVFILDSASERKKYGLVTHLTWIQVSLRILTQRVSQKQIQQWYSMKYHPSYRLWQGG